MTPPDLTATRTELLIATIALMLDGLGHIAVGASSPIPGAAALLANARGDGQPRVTVLGSKLRNDFTDGGRELFDCAAQGRIDAFFLGGGQIDGRANVNLVGLGDYPDVTVRFAGTYGSAYLYFLIPRVILFREEHTRRALVDRVDFVSAPGTSADNIYRPGGPYKMVTGRCVFDWDKANDCFTLASLHPGESLQSIRDNTGFDYIEPVEIGETPPPDAEALELIRGEVGRQIAEVYPKFAQSHLSLDTSAV